MFIFTYALFKSIPFYSRSVQDGDTKKNTLINARLKGIRDQADARAVEPCEFWNPVLSDGDGRVLMKENALRMIDDSIDSRSVRT